MNCAALLQPTSPLCSMNHQPQKTKQKLQTAKWYSPWTSTSSFLFAGRSFEELFDVLPTMGSKLIGKSFFKKYSVTPDLRLNLVHFSDSSVPLKLEHGKIKGEAFDLKATKKVAVGSSEQVMEFQHGNKDLNRHHWSYIIFCWKV